MLRDSGSERRGLESDRARLGRPAAVVGVVAVVTLAVVAGRLLVDARASIGRADAAEHAGDDEQAVAACLDAARAYFPGNPYNRAALDRLLALAARARKAGRAID